MNKKKWLTLIGIIIVVVGGLFFANFKQPSFWSASCVDLINIAFAFFIAFYFSDLITKNRRKKDAIERIILEIRSNVSDPDFFSKKPQAVTLQASCGNKIKYLKECGEENISEDIAYIEQQLETIRELHSNHVNTDLETVWSDFVASQLKIMDKCDKIQMSLYKE